VVNVHYPPAMANQQRNAAPLVSLVLPIRNEAKHLARALDAINAQTYPPERIEIIAVDGGSTDGTIEILSQRAALDPRVRVLGGPGINTPLAMRLGCNASHGYIVIKIDGHGWINDRFVEVAVGALTADPEIGCVGGMIVPLATTDIERAIALARFSRFGVGGGVYTLGERVQDTDTVQCGAYRRQAILDAGGFDPALPYGEDEEFNFRVRRAGWRIQLQPGMRYTYQVRSSLRALCLQYLRYGRARVAVVRKHPGFFRPKHAAPALLVTALGVTLALIPAGAWLVPAAVWMGYLAFTVFGAVWLAVEHRFVRVDLLGASLVALHFGYGVGTLRGLFDRPALAPSGSEGLQSSPRLRPEGEGVAEQADPEQH